MEKVDKVFELMSDLDTLNYQIKCASALVCVIQVAVESGRDHVEGKGVYADALYGAYDYLYNLNKQQEEITNDLVAEYSKRRNKTA